ncbi:MAG: hypothetical protein K1X88_00550 [Nannocystaceae bacterium]|nr:hypothetical protein [Nannocystaceae bacterium]
MAVLSFGLALVLHAAAAPAREGFDELVAKAEQAFRDKDYDAASRAFADAYALVPDPKYLFARAQAERLAQRCQIAVPLYDEYLATAPAAKQAARARDARARCVEPSATTPSAPDVDGSPSPGDPGERRPRPPSPWYRDPAGGALVGTGGLAVVIGASVLGFALARDRRAASAPTEGDYVDEKDAARAPARAGIAVLSVGGALVLAGVIRWAVLASRGERARARGNVSITPRRGRVTLGVALRF